MVMDIFSFHLSNRSLVAIITGIDWKLSWSPHGCRACNEYGRQQIIEHPGQGSPLFTSATRHPQGNSTPTGHLAHKTTHSSLAWVSQPPLSHPRKYGPPVAATYEITVRRTELPSTQVKQARKKEEENPLQAAM